MNTGNLQIVMMLEMKGTL